MGENAIIFGVDMSSSMHIDNKKKDILILGEGPIQGLDDITSTAEAEYPINFLQSKEVFLSSLHYNGSNSFLTVCSYHVTYAFQSESTLYHEARMRFSNKLRISCDICDWERNFYTSKQCTRSNRKQGKNIFEINV